MASATVMVVLKSVRVVNNGATPDVFRHPALPANVAVMSTLEFPNGMQLSQVASSLVPLGNEAQLALDLTDVYEKGMGPVRPLQFKILVEDQSPLQVEVAYNEKPDLFGKYLAMALGAAGGTLAGLIPGGSFASGAVNGLIGLLGGKLKEASGSQVQPIGEGTLRIKVSELTAEPKEYAVALTAPMDVARSWNAPNPDVNDRNNHPFVQQSGNVISKGQGNGEVVFLLYTL